MPAADKRLMYPRHIPGRMQYAQPGERCACHIHRRGERVLWQLEDVDRFLPGASLREHGCAVPGDDEAVGGLQQGRVGVRSALLPVRDFCGLIKLAHHVLSETVGGAG